MVLNILGEIPDCVTLSVSVDGKSKTLNSNTSLASFNLDQEGDYQISIKQIPDKSDITPLGILIFLLTLPIRGIFNLFLLNSDSNWYANIKPCCIKAKACVNVTGDTDVHINYTDAEYDKTQGFSLPSIEIESADVSETGYVLNVYDFKNKFFSYIKEMTSVAAVVLVLLAILLYVGISKSNYLITAVVVLAIAAMVALVIWLAFTNRKILNKISGTFLQKYSDKLKQI